ncbi:MAG TPA: YkgJ family cysteine cluster protein [Chloroflexota bacterium]|nr:YkgJ family cysteine cluster protein [Chloroflexota bacterium]
MAQRVLARIGFWLGRERFDANVDLPHGEGRPRDLVDAARQLTDLVVERGVTRVVQAGLAVSCRKGCGACCRQVVPISQPEARRLGDLVEGFDEPRQSAVRARFAAAGERIDSAGLRQRLLLPAELSDGERQALAVDYLRLGVACPFLEDESCSIYADRPLVCREYLVTTPAAHCGDPDLGPVVRIPLAGRVSVALGQLEAPTAERGVWWLPLTLALEWAERPAARDESLPKPALDLLRDLLSWLRRTTGA